MITQARNIQVCLDSYRKLSIPRVFFRAYTEAQFAPLMDEFIRNSDYDNYLIISDDLIANKPSLQLVRRTLEEKEVATGWCRQRPGSCVTNVRLKPWTVFSPFAWLIRTRYVERAGFAKIGDVACQGPIFRTFFTGSCLTGMRRKLWLEHPFRPLAKAGSDYTQCKDLMDSDIPIWCLRDAYMEHLKSRENWLVGKAKPAVIFEGGRSMVHAEEVIPDVIGGELRKSSNIDGP